MTKEIVYQLRRAAAPLYALFLYLAQGYPKFMSDRWHTVTTGTVGALVVACAISYFGDWLREMSRNRGVESTRNRIVLPVNDAPATRMSFWGYYRPVILMLLTVTVIIGSAAYGGYKIALRKSDILPLAFKMGHFSWCEVNPGPAAMDAMCAEVELINQDYNNMSLEIDLITRIKRKAATAIYDEAHSEWCRTPEDQTTTRLINVPGKTAVNATVRFRFIKAEFVERVYGARNLQTGPAVDYDDMILRIKDTVSGTQVYSDFFEYPSHTKWVPVAEK